MRCDRVVLCCLSVGLVFRPCTFFFVIVTPEGTAAAQAAAIAASEVHGTGRKKGKEKVHENRWKVAADAAANASKHGQWVWRKGGGDKTNRSWFFFAVLNRGGARKYQLVLGSFFPVLSGGGKKISTCPWCCFCCPQWEGKKKSTGIIFVIFVLYGLEGGGVLERVMAPVVENGQRLLCNVSCWGHGVDLNDACFLLATLWRDGRHPIKSNQSTNQTYKSY